MERSKIAIERDKKVALLAHDNKKRDLVEQAKYNRDLLAQHTIHATGTTGALLEQELGFPIHRPESGPLGGDQQIGAKIVDGDIEFLVLPEYDPCRHRTMIENITYWNLLRTQLRREKGIL